MMKLLSPFSLHLATLVLIAIAAAQAVVTIATDDMRAYRYPVLCSIVCACLAVTLELCAFRRTGTAGRVFGAAVCGLAALILIDDFRRLPYILTHQPSSFDSIDRFHDVADRISPELTDDAAPVDDG